MRDKASLTNLPLLTEEICSLSHSDLRYARLALTFKQKSRRQTEMHISATALAIALSDHILIDASRRLEIAAQRGSHAFLTGLKANSLKLTPPSLPHQSKAL